MLLGMIFTTIISWIIFIIAVGIVFVVIKKKKRNILNTSYALCWLGLSIIFYFEGLAAMFARRGMEDVTEALFVIMAFISYLLLAPASAFILQKAYGRKDLSTLISMLYLLSVFPYYYFFFNGEMVAQDTNYFSLNFHLTGIASFFFSVMFAPVFFVGLYIFVRAIKIYFKEKNQENLESFLFITSLFLAGIATFPEHLGVAYGWQIAFFKTLLLIAALIGFGGVYFIEKIELNQAKKEI